MVDVTVDSADLEAVLFATAAIKSVENALKAQGQDPFFAQVKGRLTEAHDRVATAWRTAQRRQTHPQLFEEPDASLIETVRYWFKHHAIGVVDGAVPIYGDVRGVRAFVSAGLCELGAEQARILWGDSGQVSARPGVAMHWMRLTPRGLRYLSAEIVEADPSPNGSA